MQKNYVNALALFFPRPGKDDTQIETFEESEKRRIHKYVPPSGSGVEGGRDREEEESGGEGIPTPGTRGAAAVAWRLATGEEGLRGT